MSSELNYSKQMFRNIIRVSDIINSDQAQRFVGPEMIDLMEAREYPY